MNAVPFLLLHLHSIKKEHHWKQNGPLGASPLPSVFSVQIQRTTLLHWTLSEWSEVTVQQRRSVRSNVTLLRRLTARGVENRIRLSKNYHNNPPICYKQLLANKHQLGEEHHPLSPSSCCTIRPLSSLTRSLSKLYASSTADGVSTHRMWYFHLIVSADKRRK